MKKVINGAVYNTETAKKICEQKISENQYEKGAYVNQLKQLYKTKNGNYFFFVKNEFPTYVDVNGDDLNPKFELMDVTEEKIIPATYELAVQFASEVIASDLESKIAVGKFFPELIRNEKDENKKVQKKVYMSEKASWYLEMMLTESKETNSSFIEKLIVDKYRSLYKEGIMQNDPYFEMEEE
ncbi:hypothetical protein [Alkalicoccus daliensis]|uniref:Uncharacterized protein n=1 Tax=Alkalicoccus daliensis TaxID=745820 RepID=A0A1H0E8S1_9BACI|nr:hypothetical protein [Alkalicoccus daliensis]SDN78794.1 hypothetical protein SAMN04488053_103248 [Alkalicoccus daliensis]